MIERFKCQVSVEVDYIHCRWGELAKHTRLADMRTVVTWIEDHVGRSNFTFTPDPYEGSGFLLCRSISLNKEDEEEQVISDGNWIVWSKDQPGQVTIMAVPEVHVALTTERKGS